MPTYRLMVMTNPVAGREDEYNEWYTNVHLPDVVKIPGIVSAQRFSRSEVQRPGAEYPWGYLAIYDCETDNPQAIIDELNARRDTELMRMTDALAGERFVCFFEPITERVTS